MVVKYKNTKVKRKGKVEIYDSEGKRTDNEEDLKRKNSGFSVGTGAGTLESPQKPIPVTKEEYEQFKKEGSSGYGGDLRTQTNENLLKRKNEATQESLSELDPSFFQGQKKGQELQVEQPKGMIPGLNAPSLDAFRTNALLNSVNIDTIKDMSFEDFINNPEVANNPTLAQLVQNEVDFEVLKSQEAQAIKTGTLIEGIPFIGGLARKYAGGLITTPSSQVDDILGEIGNELSIARNYREWVGMGTMSPDIALENFQTGDERIAFLESKLKFLIAQSAELQSSPEEVDRVMVKIKEYYKVTENGREKAALMAANKILPTPADSFKTLQNLRGKK